MSKEKFERTKPLLKLNKFFSPKGARFRQVLMYQFSWISGK
jgi:hypothetical protein